MLRTIPRSLFAVCVAISTPFLGACGNAPVDGEEAVQSGVVSLPLVTEANGHRYRVRQAFIQISGPTFTTLFSTDDPNETALSATLQTGSYSAYLYNWTLERDDGTGQFQPVVATLVSSPFVSFGIENGTTTTVTYVFQTDGVIVTVGSGGLKVRVAVNEIAAACTPFGTDCPSGAWCPPTGLTAAARACVAEGSVIVGQPCGAPAECVANASCFDLGDGPVCAALCPSSAFGLACESGGTCQAAGVDYGVCR
jgi:hypothetical protein